VEISAAGDGDDRQGSAIVNDEYMVSPPVAAGAGLDSRSRREAAERALQAYLKASATAIADALAADAVANYS
jgi:hypothetical protein